MRKAFTLIELLVVITIMGIVAGLALPNLTRAIDQARETTCRTNLRNLQAAVVNHSVAHNNGELPLAGSYESHRTDFATDASGNMTADLRDLYRENRGWVSWTHGPNNSDWSTLWNNGNNQNDSTTGDSISTSHADKMFRTVGTLWKNSGGERAIDKGALWRHTGMDKRIYRCPVAARHMLTRSGKRNDTMMVTYVMNEYFGHDGYRVRRYFPRLDNFGSERVDASTLLLFAERRWGVEDGEGQGIWESSVLCTKGEKDEQNTFGMYHGKRQTRPADYNKYGPGTHGLVVFMDGHVDNFPAMSDGKNVAWHLSRSRDNF